MRQDAQRNRERILAAAEAVFGERGAAGSTEDVARRAGVGIATVFRHYPTKDALIDATLLRHFNTLTCQARELADAADPQGALRTLIHQMITTGATKITLAAAAEARGLPPTELRTAADELRDAVDVVLRRAQSPASARATVTVDDVYLLIRALSQASASTPTPTATLERAIDIILVGIEAPDSPYAQPRAADPR